MSDLTIDLGVPLTTFTSIRDDQPDESWLWDSGYYSSVWEGCDEKGRRVAAGVYFIRFDAGEFQAQDRILLVR